MTEQMALCVGMDPEVFFPGSGRPPKAAVDACRRCPIEIRCMFDALRSTDEGYRGGLTKAERDRIRAWDRRARKRAGVAA
ncbi:MAG: WhiB family transcriptional regulator [Microbispora sp.]|nr:WhiB family transcriptional regulator [Microbispora sp.]